MTDRERDAMRLLACYVAEERPPPEVDAQILARLRREAHRRKLRRQVLVGALAVAAVLLLWLFAARESLFRSDRHAPSAAAHESPPAPAGGSAQQRARTRSEPTAEATEVPSPESAPPPKLEPDGDDPGVEALRDARRLIGAGEFAAARARLEPCPRVVGTDDLREECEALVIESLCRAGEVVAGRVKMASFRDLWPESAHTRRLSKTCLR